ncbi:hypothetical protein K503DRAFT_729679 [Rhizopogon vinicolor AM-OR11-026]|uniref:Association with the SNF1 complex (ASC) domain-containing protein n=1 Tax=Rhizopogon vinicolor AM-OR11-026 TaxID=1314800 RepID=A0A1B7NHE3_9AGAM|nr:hypothetical protein K503DRAFT_729679 [Rhizopogon vinicolor AM-OR11-026]
MGNTASNNSQNSRSPVPSRRIDSSPRRQAPSHSPSPNPHQPHRSLRKKRKSLELPDLASLTLTPAASYHNSGNSSPLSPYRRPLRTTSPIPIPTPAFNNGTMNNASNTGTSPRGRQPNLKVTGNRDTDTANYSAELLLDQPPSTHIPVHHRPRGSPYFRGASLRYNSTHSFTSRGQSTQPRMQELYAESEIDTSVQPDPSGFIQETVHSTLPLALHKAEEEIADSANVDPAGENGQLIKRPDDSHEETKEPVSVKITWNGGGKNVVLVRAGDDNWKGRLPMELDGSSSDKSWSAWVPLMPGTHHIRFIVDEQWRVADDLPTAVDDEGSLANYVAVPISGLTPPNAASAVPAAPVGRHPHPHAHSFWSTTSSTHDSVTDTSSTTDPNGTRARWTDVIPPELVAAAREEESYLAYTAGPEYDQAPYQHVPTPNIPPAPGLPRHLDKLILNTKVGPSTAGTRGRERDRERERERERESRRRQGRSLLGMTSTVARELDTELETPAIPITTASGTDVTSVHLAAPAHTRLGLDGTGLSDDASVLPVPSHVVLHHLSTSAIRNGVLAVANTTRYRTKYLTTIYYKPT